MTTPFDCIPLSFWRLIWRILLCHSSMSVSVLRHFANMADFTFVSRINIRPSLWLWEMSRPSFSMKQPPWLNRTCIPCSWSNHLGWIELASLAPQFGHRDQILHYGWNMQYVFDTSLFTFFPKWDIANMLNRVSSIISGLDITGSIRLSKFLELFLMGCHSFYATTLCRCWLSGP